MFVCPNCCGRPGVVTPSFRLFPSRLLRLKGWRSLGKIFLRASCHLPQLPEIKTHLLQNSRPAVSLSLLSPNYTFVPIAQPLLQYFFTSTHQQTIVTTRTPSKAATSFTMAASATQNPQVKSDSKSSKKKKSKTTSTETEASTAPAPGAEVTPSNAATESNNGDGGYESPYIKELYK